MCEGFRRAGHDIVLYHADRKQINNDLVGVDVQDYLGVTHQFETKRLPYIDVNYLHEYVSDWLLRPFIIVSHLLFTIVAVFHMWKADADLYVTREWPVAYLLVKLGLPTVFEIHKLRGSAFSDRGRRMIGSLGTNDALKTVVTLTNPTADGLAKLGIPREKIHVDPDAVDIEKYDDPLSKSEARDEVDLPQDTFIVGYTGSLHSGKGPYALADACTQIDDVTVVYIGGTDDEVKQLSEYLTDHGGDTARVVGSVSPTAVPKYQWAADVLALPPTAKSHSQKHHPESTSPLKLFEYMAAERPIVATRLPGIEAVLADEENALLANPDDVEAIRTAIERLRDNPALRESLAQQARIDVEDYTWQARAKRIHDTALD